jgi:hypothetical protein
MPISIFVAYNVQHVACSYVAYTKYRNGRDLNNPLESLRLFRSLDLFNGEKTAVKNLLQNPTWDSGITIILK